MTVAATAILSSLLLMVAALNWLDPKITNLVPVLDSYWLIIHLGYHNCKLWVFGTWCIVRIPQFNLNGHSSSTNKVIAASLKELTFINEMSITTGLFMPCL